MRLSKKISLAALLILIIWGCNTFEWDLKKKPQFVRFEIISIQDTSLVIDYEIESTESPVSEIKCLVYTDTTSDAILMAPLQNTEGLATISPLNGTSGYFIRIECKNNVGKSLSDFSYFETLSGPPGSPDIETLGFSQVSYTSAQITGNVVNPGASNVTSRGFKYSTSSNMNNTTSVSNGSGPGNFSCNLTSLTPETNYYYQAFATNSSGTSYGEIVSFETLNGNPNVETLNYSQVSYTSAQITGNVSSSGATNVTSRGFKYSNSPNMNNHSTVYSGSGTGNFSFNLSNLTSSSSYYFQAFATNSSGTSFGEILSFETLNGNPNVETLNYSQVSYTSAQITGSVTNSGASNVTSRGFNYSTSSNMNNNSVVYSGSGTGNYSYNLTNLTPGSNYYYQAFATNSSGTSVGEIVSFQTENVPNINLGDYYQGGIVGYIYQPGDPHYIANEVHGIIVSEDEQVGYGGGFNEGGKYSPSIGTYYGANSYGLENPESNTNILVSSIGGGAYAAKICSDLVLNGYSDWYLPTVEECQIVDQLWYLNNLSFDSGLNHWTSTEINATKAYQFDFIYGAIINYENKNTNGWVRAFRRF